MGLSGSKLCLYEKFMLTFFFFFSCLNYKEICEENPDFFLESVL